jgi:hypothetical protein
MQTLIMRGLRHRYGRIVGWAHREIRRLSPATPGGHVATVRFAAVLDGHTLNLDLALADVPYAPDARATIELRRGRRRVTAPARLRADGRASAVSAAVLLGEEIGGLPLESGGPWRVSCVIAASGGSVRRLPLQGAPPPLAHDGPTIAAPRSASTGVRYRVDRDIAGRLTVTPKPPRAVAEVERLALDWTSAELTVRLLGIDGRDATFSFSSRDGLGIEAVPARVLASSATCAIPVGRLAPVSSVEELLWDVRLNAGRAVRTVRVGRVLHDLVNAKSVLRLDTAVVWVDRGTSVRVRPYYTQAGGLVLACLRVHTTPAEQQE